MEGSCLSVGGKLGMLGVLRTKPQRNAILQLLLTKGVMAAQVFVVYEYTYVHICSIPGLMYLCVKTRPSEVGYFFINL